MKVIKYSDPGHGWAKVPKLLLTQLGISDQITPYSYVRGKYAYLEEDADLTCFEKAMKRAGKKVEYDDKIADKQSRIRNYEPYPAKPGVRCRIQ